MSYTESEIKSLRSHYQVHSILCQLYERLGGVITSSTPLPREISQWPRVSITTESLQSLRETWEKLSKLLMSIQNDTHRH